MLELSCMFNVCCPSLCYYFLSTLTRTQPSCLNKLLLELLIDTTVVRFSASSSLWPVSWSIQCLHSFRGQTRSSQNSGVKILYSFILYAGPTNNNVMWKKPTKVRIAHFYLSQMMQSSLILYWLKENSWTQTSQYKLVLVWESLFRSFPLQRLVKMKLSL